MWRDANILEHKKLAEYDVFVDKGQFAESKIPKGYKKISVHTVFDVKHDGQHRARVVADGHLTDVPLESVYAGVVSLRGIRTCIFLAELNGMIPYATDISSAYLEAYTTERVCIRAGPEFGDLEGHLLIVIKALYGLRTSGKMFIELLADCLINLGFTRSRAEDSIFMKKSDDGKVYEYVATYCDDLCIISKNPDRILHELQSDPWNFKFKGTGPLNFHLGCGFNRDKDGTLCVDPGKYIKRMEEAYERLFGEKPRDKCRSPLPKGDHPELDHSEFLGEEETEIYQSLIGSMQWAVSIGRFDIQVAVMTLSSFRAQPRRGHLERAKRVYQYLVNFKHYKLRFRTDLPDYSDVPPISEYIDWSHTAYGNNPEEKPNDAPEPLGKPVIITNYYDASLMHA